MADNIVLKQISRHNLITNKMYFTDKKNHRRYNNLLSAFLCYSEILKRSLVAVIFAILQTHQKFTFRKIKKKVNLKLTDCREKILLTSFEPVLESHRTFGKYFPQTCSLVRLSFTADSQLAILHITQILA